MLSNMDGYERKVIVRAPVNHPLNFFSVGWLVSIGYQSFNGGIIWKLEYQRGAAVGSAVIGEKEKKKSVNSGGESTHLWGAPVFSTRGSGSWELNLTTWVQLRRKLKIYLLAHLRVNIQQSVEEFVEEFIMWYDCVEHWIVCSLWRVFVHRWWGSWGVWKHDVDQGILRLPLTCLLCRWTDVGLVESL